MQQSQDQAQFVFEREKLAFERQQWEADLRRRDRDLDRQERELELRSNELKSKNNEADRSRRWNPLNVVIIGATITALANVMVSELNGRSTRQLESFKAESARISDMIKTGSPDAAAKNLEFLVQAGLITTPQIAEGIRNYLANRAEGQGVALPASSRNVCEADPATMSQLLSNGSSTASSSILQNALNPNSFSKP